MTVSQYLARLAAEATTVINAEDYGRTIYDLAIRRALIVIGEDMVNVAYDAPVDFAPREQIEEAERRLYELAETGRYDGGFQRFATALTTAIDMAAQRLSARRQALRHRDRPRRSRPHDGRPAAVRSDHPRRPPRHGQDRARDQHRLQHRAGLARRDAAGRPIKTVNGGIVGFFSLEMSAEQLATRIIAEQTGIPSYQHPPRRDRADATSTRSPRVVARDAEHAALHRRDRRPLDRAARGARAPAEAPARPRPAGHRLSSSSCRARARRAQRAACRK